jgi:hypothetical protein
MRKSTLGELYNEQDAKKREIHKSRKFKKKMKDNFFKEYIVVEEVEKKTFPRKEKVNHR